MQLNLVFVGLPARAQSDWTLLCETCNARAWFFNQIDAIDRAPLSQGNVLMVPFENGSDIQDVRRIYQKSGGSNVSVAILPDADFALCGAAFRAGVSDVIAQPLSRPDFDGLIKRLRLTVTRSVHPDAIRSLAMVEKTAIGDALRACNGQVSKTARKLGIGRSTLYRKLDHHGLAHKS